MERIAFTHRRQYLERDVLGKRSRSPDVQAGKIKPVGRDALFELRTIRLVDRHFVRVFQMPLWRYAEGNREISGVLIDRQILIITQLIPIVLERDTKVIQKRPTDMACRTGKTVLSRERRNRISRLAGKTNERGKEQGEYQARLQKRTRPRATLVSPRTNLHNLTSIEKRTSSDDTRLGLKYAFDDQWGM